MRKFTVIFLCLVVLILSLCGCANSNDNMSTEDIATSDENVQLTQSNDPLNEVLKIYEESMEANISTYCQEYLTFEGSPIDNLEEVKSIITEEYYEQIKATEHYQSENKDYEQATALNTLYFEDYSTPSEKIKVLALCYQSVVVDNKSTTYNTFYIFNMKYDEQNGWLIDSVEKPSDEYLKE